MRRSTLITLMAGATLASTANAAEIAVTSNITGPGTTTWTADNTYNLQGQIYVEPGATLVIEAGVVVASDAGGGLAVARGAQIFVQGTQAEPVIMTSKADVATWAADPGHPTGKDPKTGTYRQAANEWGNLTLMGSAYISEDATVGNQKFPDAGNVAAMEGLTQIGLNEYGGGNDDDDSGQLSYLSLRYGGRAVSLNNELNGLSMGGIGRGTDVDHIEIMNNVDDGIETWGGTVNYKYFSIWNVGDDSFDVDQGWRGKAQFGLIVQGYSVDGVGQGSGIGDNCFEIDGAEDSDYQPVTSATIYNCTVIGQPANPGGDHALAFRDGARVQYRNLIVMDIGGEVVKNDFDDGDGASGYGHNGTLPFFQTWTTPFNSYSNVNPPQAPLTSADLYQAQTDGFMTEVKDTVFFRNQNPAAYTTANNNNVFAASNNNTNIAGIDDADSPIQALSRNSVETLTGPHFFVQVTNIDPRPKNEALTAVGSAPADGFFTPANYSGAFAPDENWLKCWTAADAYGFVAPLPGKVTSVPGGNPDVLSNSTQPTIGSTLTASIDHSSFVPSGLVDLALLEFETATIPGPSIGAVGTVLVDIFTGADFLLLQGAPGSAFNVPIPDNCNFVGLEVYLQGLSASATDFTLNATNRLDVLIGG